MQLIEILVIITFIVLLGAAIFMLVNFYICDSQNCKAFNHAKKIAPKGTKEYVTALLGELCNDGIWPLPYIGASILTPISLWFMDVPITTKNFAILFFISFAVMYFIFSFFGHHYIKFVSKYASNYIIETVPSSKKSYVYNEEIENNDVCKQSKTTFSPFMDNLDVTFASPVKIY